MMILCNMKTKMQMIIQGQRHLLFMQRKEFTTPHIGNPYVYVR